MLAGAKQVASWLHLINPLRSERFASPNQAGDMPGPGVSIGLECAPLEHSGIYYSTILGERRLLHFGNHHTILDDSPLVQAKFSWARPNLRPHHVPQIEELCVLIADNRAAIQSMIPYGFKYSEASLFSVFDGSFKAADGTTGLTCATFVLAILRTAGVRLVKTASWPQASGVAAQIDYLRRRIRNYGQSLHTQRLNEEIGCVRFSPSQVAGACLYDWHPVDYHSAETGAALAMSAVVADYKRRGIPWQ
jgi:hypothetical protein